MERFVEANFTVVANDPNHENEYIWDNSVLLVGAMIGKGGFGEVFDASLVSVDRGTHIERGVLKEVHRGEHDTDELFRFFAADTAREALVHSMLDCLQQTIGGPQLVPRVLFVGAKRVELSDGEALVPLMVMEKFDLSMQSFLNDLQRAPPLEADLQVFKILIQVVNIIHILQKYTKRFAHTDMNMGNILLRRTTPQTVFIDCGGINRSFTTDVMPVISDLGISCLAISDDRVILPLDNANGTMEYEGGRSIACDNPSATTGSLMHWLAFDMKYRFNNEFGYVLADIMENLFGNLNDFEWSDYRYDLPRGIVRNEFIPENLVQTLFSALDVTNELLEEEQS